MGHPSIEEIVAGRCDEHLARCDTCRRLATMADVAAPASGGPEPTDDLDRLPAVDDALYTEWEPLADARGGMGRIFRARDRRLGRHVAIKQLAEHLGAGERAALVRRFEREARLTARLQHPSIVGIYEAGRFADGEPFYAMPLLRGQPLSAAIARAAGLAGRLALLPHVIAVAEAVAFAHDEGIVHRDLKPDNVLVGTSGETVLIDWGLAKDLREAAADGDGVYRAPPPNDGLTQLGVGTAHYMPPEQARGEEPDVRADVYALGATLYHLLAGAPPYGDRGSTGARLAKFDERPPRPLAEAAPACPRELVDIVDRAMAQDKAVRFASARALADELRRFQTGQLLTSRRYTLGELVRHFARRHRTALRITALAAALVLAIAVVAFVGVARERDRAERQQARAERELRRAQGIVASQTASEPGRRLDAVLLGLGAVAPDLGARRAVAPEALQGLLDALTAGPPLVPLEHEGVIKHFARSGDRLLGVDDARAVVVWDADSGRRLARWPSALPQPERPVASPDGARAVVCGYDPIGEVFELATGANRTFEAKANLEGCGFLPDGRLITAADEVVVRDPDSLVVRERWPLPRPAQGMAIAPSGRVAVTALGGALWLWRPGGAPTLVATALPLGAASAFAADERTLYQIGADQIVRAFDVARPDAPPAVMHAETALHLIGVSPSGDGRRIAVSAFDVDGDRRSLVLATAGAAGVGALGGNLLAWLGEPGWALVDRGGPLAIVDAEGDVNPDGDRTVLALDAHATEVSALAGGDRLVSASRDGAAYLWDLTGGAEGGMLLGHTGEIVALAARGDALLSAGEDGALRLWDAATGATRVRVDGAREVSAAAWLGDAIVAGDLGGGVRVLDRAGAVRAQAASPAPIAAIAAAPDGARVAIGALDGTLELRDAALARPLVLGADGAGAVTALAWSPDGARVASAHVDGSTRLWDVATGAALAVRPDPRPVDEPGDHEGHLALAFAGDGATLYAARPAGETLVLAAGDLATRATLPGRLLAVAADGTLATAIGDGGVLIHPPGGGAPITLAAGAGAALAAAFADDGRLAVAHVGGTVELWAARGHERIATLTASGLGPATALAFTGAHLAVGHASGALRLHPTTPAAAVARACGIAARFGRARETAAYCGGAALGARR
jgi:WD40 repeat protein